MNATSDNTELIKLHTDFQQAYWALDNAYGDFISFVTENKIDYSDWINIKFAASNTDSEFSKLLDEVEKFCIAHSAETFYENHS